MTSIQFPASDQAAQKINALEAKFNLAHLWIRTTDVKKKKNNRGEVPRK